MARETDRGKTARRPGAGRGSKAVAAARDAVRSVGRVASNVRLRVRERRRRSREANGGMERERLTVKLPRSLIERARDAVFWTPGMTLTSLVETSLRTAIAALERARGSAFPEREHDLRAGRPRIR